MAATIKRAKLQNVGTVATDLTTGTETGPAASKVWNIPRLYVVNITASAVNVTVTHVTGATSTNLVKSKSLAANDTMILENITLVNGDKIQVLSGTATSLDVFGSIIEEDA